MIGKGLVSRLLFRIFFLVPLIVVSEIPVFLAGAALGTYIVFSRNLPEIPELASYQPKTVSTFYADDGTVIGIFYKQKRFVVDLPQIPPHVVNAFLASEDGRFFEHSGVDWTGLVRAMVRNVRAGRIVQGGMDHHHASYPELPTEPGKKVLTKNQGDYSCSPTGEDLGKTKDPPRLPERNLSGRKLLWGRGRSPMLL